MQVSVTLPAASAARDNVEGFSTLWDAILDSVGGDKVKARKKTYSSLRKYTKKSSK